MIEYEMFLPRRETASRWGVRSIAVSVLALGVGCAQTDTAPTSLEDVTIPTDFQFRTQSTTSLVAHGALASAMTALPGARVEVRDDLGRVVFDGRARRLERPVELTLPGDVKQVDVALRRGAVERTFRARRDGDGQLVVVEEVVR